MKSSLLAIPATKEHYSLKQTWDILSSNSLKDTGSVIRKYGSFRLPVQFTCLERFGCDLQRRLKTLPGGCSINVNWTELNWDPSSNPI